MSLPVPPGGIYNKVAYNRWLVNSQPNYLAHPLKLGSLCWSVDSCTFLPSRLLVATGGRLTSEKCTTMPLTDEEQVSPLIDKRAEFRSFIYVWSTFVALSLAYNFCNYALPHVLYRRFMLKRTVLSKFGLLLCIGYTQLDSAL